MKLKVYIVFLLVFGLMLSGCGSKAEETIQNQEIKDEATSYSKEEPEHKVSKNALPEPATQSNPEEMPTQIQEEDVESMELVMIIDGIEVSVAWEDNESVAAIRELAASGGLEINMSKYGGFEQVGSVGQSIPSNDEQTTTQAGDIVLYSGDQVVVFYGSNSWAYTRLGRITDKTEQELTEMLGNGDVVLRFETVLKDKS